MAARTEFMKQKPATHCRVFKRPSLLLCAAFTLLLLLPGCKPQTQVNDLSSAQVYGWEAAERYLEAEGWSQCQKQAGDYATRPACPGEVVCRYEILAVNQDGETETVFYGVHLLETEDGFSILDEGPHVDETALLDDTVIE